MSTSDSSNIPALTPSDLAERFRNSGSAQGTLVRALEVLGRPLIGVDLIIPRHAHPSILMATQFNDHDPHLPERQYQWLRSIGAETPVEADAWSLHAAWSFGADQVYRTVVPSLANKAQRSGYLMKRVNDLIVASATHTAVGHPDPRGILPMLDEHGGVFWSFPIVHGLFQEWTADKAHRAMLRDRSLLASGRRDGLPPANILSQCLAITHAHIHLAKPRVTKTLPGQASP